MLCSGTLHQHKNHDSNRDKKPDVTGICCLNARFMSLPVKGWEGQIFLSMRHYIPFMSLTAVFETPHLRSLFLPKLWGT